MYLQLSKILPLMILPIGLVVELSLLALLFLWRDRTRGAGFLLMAAILILYGSSTPYVGDALLGSLERQYPAIGLDEVPESECLVVLGGAVEPVLAPRLDVDLKDASDRVYKAATLYRAGKARQVIVAGGNQPWSPYAQSEAEAIRVLLLNWGVQLEAIKLDGVSRNTRENAVNAKLLMVKSGCGQKSLLVTSAAHMKRALASFESVGVKMVPVSADVRVVNAGQLTVFDFLPDPEALKNTTDAMREWIGQQVYRFKGWN